MDEHLDNIRNTDPPEVSRANGRLIFGAAIAGFFVAFAGLGGVYFYASHGTETGPGQTAQVQQAEHARQGNTEPPRENNPNPPGDRGTQTR
jgi:hypothetical protein